MSWLITLHVVWNIYLSQQQPPFSGECWKMGCIPTKSYCLIRPPKVVHPSGPWWMKVASTTLLMPPSSSSRACRQKGTLRCKNTFPRVHVGLRWGRRLAGSAGQSQQNSYLAWSISNSLLLMERTCFITRFLASARWCWLLSRYKEKM